VVEDYYNILGIHPNASFKDIKKAFHEKAKHIHPDIAGNTTNEMRLLITAYETLSNNERRYEYDRSSSRFTKKRDFDYRAFLEKRADDPHSQAKLILFELFHNAEESALTIWRRNGGLDFKMNQYLERGDWMDGTYVLAEELEKRRYYYEAFVILTELVKEERRFPYFKHFAVDLETFLKEMVRLHLKPSVDEETWVVCMRTLLELGFSVKEEVRWMRSMAESLFSLGSVDEARSVFHKALSLDPSLQSAKRLRKKLMV
jgi:curved DNA-binding protein CbpA